MCAGNSGGLLERQIREKGAGRLVAAARGSGGISAKVLLQLILL